LTETAVKALPAPLRYRLEGCLPIKELLHQENHTNCSREGSAPCQEVVERRKLVNAYPVLEKIIYGHAAPCCGRGHRHIRRDHVQCLRGRRIEAKSGPAVVRYSVFECICYITGCAVKGPVSARRSWAMFAAYQTKRIRAVASCLDLSDLSEGNALISNGHGRKRSSSLSVTR
jgi:hypothetical protein